MALVLALSRMAKAKEKSIGVAHFNHGWRGGASDEDEQFVTELAGRLGLPILRARAEKSSSEDSHQGRGAESIARDERHAFFQKAAQQVGARYIATGHTADDQVETVLHRIFRGTGISGLSGIPKFRYLGDGLTLVRPMLTIQRACVISYLQAQQQPYRIDATNADSAFTRNMIRHEVLPFLQAKFGDQVPGNILKLAEQADAVQQLIDAEVAELYAASVHTEAEHSVRINLKKLQQQPLHLLRELFKRIWQIQDWPLREMDFARWNQLAELAGQGADFNSVTLPGNICVRFHQDSEIQLCKS